MNYEGQTDSAKEGIFSGGTEFGNAANTPERDMRAVGDAIMKQANGLEMPNEDGLKAAAVEGDIAGNSGNLEAVSVEGLGEIVELEPMDSVVEKTNTDGNNVFSMGKEFSKGDGKITDEEIKKLKESPFDGYEGLQADRETYLKNSFGRILGEKS